MQVTDRNGISFRREQILNSSRTWNAAATVASLALLAGCGGLSDRTFWWPQSPGGPVGQREAPAREPEPAARAPAQPQASGRQFEVAPQLVTQSPPPPRVAAPAAGADELPATVGGYTQLTRYGDLVFISGQIAMDLKGGSFNE